MPRPSSTSLFFFNDTATTEIYTLSLHDALPISRTLRFTGSPRPVGPQPHHGLRLPLPPCGFFQGSTVPGGVGEGDRADRKSKRLNSSHGYNSYAVFCFKKKKKKDTQLTAKIVYR